MSLNTINRHEAQKVHEQQPSATQRLEQPRRRMKPILRSVEFHEGRLLDYHSAEDMTQTLILALRDIEAVQLSVAVMERKAVTNG